MLSQCTLVFLLSVATYVLAIPTVRGTCMTWDEADTLATKFGQLISSYSDSLALAVLMPSFTDYSESVNTLINSCPQGDAAKAITQPLLGPTFSSRQQFMTGQGQQPPINFERLDMWHTCEGEITIRWSTNNTAPIPEPKPVVGIIALVAKRCDSGVWKIRTAFSEFDAGAWLQNLEQAGICNSDPIQSPPALESPPVPTPVPSLLEGPEPVHTGPFNVVVPSSGRAYQTPAPAV